MSKKKDITSECEMGPLTLDGICAALAEIVGDRWEGYCSIKFSQMLALGSDKRFGDIPIVYSIYLKHEDIFFHWVINLKIREFRVGKMVWEYLQSTDDPFTAGWVRYRANKIGLARPYVSME